MEREVVLKMEAGNELDSFIDQKVMVKESHGFFNSDSIKKNTNNKRKIQQYSTNACFAEKVIGRIREKHPVILYGGAIWECKVFFLQEQ